MQSKAGLAPAPLFLRFFTSADSRVNSSPPGLRTAVAATSLVSASVLRQSTPSEEQYVAGAGRCYFRRWGLLSGKCHEKSAQHGGQQDQNLASSADRLEGNLPEDLRGVPEFKRFLPQSPAHQLRSTPRLAGLFSMFGGMIVGRNIEPNQRMVQAWRPRPDFPEGTYSLVTIA